MSRRLVALSAVLAVLAIALPGLLLPDSALADVIIDTFETGAISMAQSAEGEIWGESYPSAAHCISTGRSVILGRDPGSGTLTCDITPLAGQDDAAECTFAADAHSVVILRYVGGPWDLTEGGQMDRILLQLTGGGSTVYVGVEMYDENSFSWHDSHHVAGAGGYVFDLPTGGPDMTAVEVIHVYLSGVLGESVGVKDIRTMTLSRTPLTWSLVGPSVFFWQCNAANDGAAAGEAPGLGRGAANSLAWDWAVDWPAPQTLAGPVLEVTNVSGPSCSSVNFQGAAPGSFGDMGMVTVDWEAATFQNATMIMRFATDPAAGYVATSLGEPVVTVLADAAVISYDVAVSGVPGVPDGVMRQDVILSAHPDQALTFDWTEASSYSAGGATGISYGFGVSATAFDPASPLLEIFTTATYSDDAGNTGVEAVGAAGLATALAAHPSVTRGGTRFVLPAGAVESMHARATVDVFDVSGRRVRTLEARGGEAAWDGASEAGTRVSAGVYFGRADGVSGAARVIVLR